MFTLECEKCHTKFHIKDGEIGLNGRFVRCTVCSHEWVATPPEDMLTSMLEKVSASGKTESPASPPRLTAVPKVDLSMQGSITKVIGSFFFMVICGLLLVGAGAILYRPYVVRVFPETESLYQRINLYNTKGVRFQRIEVATLDNSEVSTKTVEISLNLTLVNTTNQPKRLGAVRVSTFDEGKNLMDQAVIFKDEIINANSPAQLNGTLRGIPKAAKFLSVDFGNEAELRIINITKLLKN
jgi:predicted Zn finger-like uncharacterized protein